MPVILFSPHLKQVFYFPTKVSPPISSRYLLRSTSDLIYCHPIGCSGFCWVSSLREQCFFSAVFFTSCADVRQDIEYMMTKLKCVICRFSSNAIHFRYILIHGLEIDREERQELKSFTCCVFIRLAISSFVNDCIYFVRWSLRRR